LKVVKGFIVDQEENYQLNVINHMRQGIRNFARQEIITRKDDGTLFRYTYKDSYERMQRLANALRSIGIKVGDRVGIIAWNHHQHFEIYYGLPGMGAVMVSLNLNLTPADLSYVINHSVAPLCKAIEGYIIITDNNLSDLNTKLNPIYSYEELLNKASPLYDWPYLDENSSYAACYTTGTTGKPKGVYYSHREIYIHALMFTAKFSISVNDVVFQMVPMFHVLGWSIPQASAYAGAKLIFSGKWNLPDLKELTYLMAKEKVTISAAVPTVLMAMYEIIRKMDEKPDLKGARFLCGGSEPPITLMRGFWDETGGEIVHTYGSTEGLAIVTLNYFKPWLKKELSSEILWDLKKKQGTINSGIDIKIVDEEGNALPHDGITSGEILLRGPWITRTYYNSDRTKDSFTDDGFFRTGDAGSIDSEGYLKITDRIKDVIKSGGEWISSIDMENTLMSHTNILEAAVVGIPHPKWEERPLALVVLREGFESINEDEIRKYLTKNFAKWQLPDKIIFVDSIPRTSVGKLNKKVIRMEYKEIYNEI
jgi:fatty-acyl-CoA synthase